MCGISGIVQNESDDTDLRASSLAMTWAMAHRGPDDEGVESISVEPPVWFGHKRLSIIDLSPAGHQPMHDPDTGNWLTFNGEIYNFISLRRELEARQQRFRTRTDTEVILKAYAVWGVGCIRRLRGMFAFALWDSSRRRLLLVRDQLGVKPFYIYQGNKRIVFASEVRALLASGLVPRKVDTRGLQSCLAFGSVQEPFTLVHNVRSLAPGHFMEWRNGVIRTEAYWELPLNPIRPETSKDIHEQAAHMLEDAVSHQLIADVPLGAFLSGGIDSTSIAALMCKAAKGPVRTFSIVFKELPYDERAWSQIAALHLGTLHTELELTGEMVRAGLPAALDAFDQPSIDGLNTFFVSKAVREAGLRVALSGVGGDELFGGYSGYRRALLAERCHSATRIIPGLARKGISNLLARQARSEPARKAGELLSTQRHPYFITRKLFSNYQVRQLLIPELALSDSWEKEAFGDIEAVTTGYDPINRASAFELRTFMLSTLLRDTDQMSMAHSLEVRVPLIDSKLVEYCFSLPGNCKLNGNLPKPLLTHTLGSLLPQECVRRPKRGFELPFQVWFRESMQAEMRSSLYEAVPCRSSPFHDSALRQIWDQFENRQLNWSRVWAIFVLRLWLGKHRLAL
ncbi:MAG: asparagine synthase (glutamine-hydrolyzing) [Syntrophobacteraceae bacterium]